MEQTRSRGKRRRMRSHRGHVHAGSVTGQRLLWAIGLTFLFVIGEGLAGWIARSLALQSDAWHNFTDALALVFSAYAINIARKPSDSRRTFGYHRVGILAALANAATLAVIAVGIFWEAIQRFQRPEPVQSGYMIGVALVAVVLNSVIGMWLHADAKHDLNVRSAYLHMIGDAISGVGVVLAGVLVAATHNPVWDPIISLLIGAMILWSSWGILVEAVDVLLEGAPAGVDVRAVESTIGSVPGVLNVHDLHVWSVASGIHACSCHILVAEQSVRSGEQLLRLVRDVLSQQFRISHTTVQVEVEGCEENDIHCTMQALTHGHHHDDHGHKHDHGHTHGHGHSHDHGHSHHH